MGRSCASKPIADSSQSGGATTLEHIVPFGSEEQMIAKCFGEPECTIGTDIFIGDAPRSLRREKDKLSLCSKAAGQRQHGRKPESGVGDAALLISLIGDVVDGIQRSSGGEREGMKAIEER